MTDLVNRYAEDAFVLSIVGAAMIWPPLALVVGALYKIALAVVSDRRTPPVEPKA